jgi:hypothetical protein
MPRIPHDAEHLFRLAALFAAGVVIFLVLRSLMVPAGFGELGHYRPGAIGTNQQRRLHFAGRAACTECHSEIATALVAAKHGKIGCEACHGPLAAHAADPDDPKLQPAKLDGLTLCSRCHAADPARPLGHPQVEVAAHSEGERCTECHAAHDPALQ